MKTLIAYFSHIGETLENNNIVVVEKGNTEKVAEKIHSLIDSDLYKIVEAEPYPFGYMECNNRAKIEDQNNDHPELLDKVGIDISQYDTIYLGFPIWYRTYPRVIASFLDRYDFSGKTIIPFCTNDEEYFGIALLELQSIAKDATIIEGLVVRGVNVDSSDKEIEDFVNSNKSIHSRREKNMKKWVCPVCGYVYEGDEIPAGFVCPTCKCPGDKFTEMVEGAALAAEHKFGIGTQLNEVPEEDKKYILEQLKANFNGECSEVGMYLCMARVAHREGYPEIGLYWEKAAYEEAEHASKFAELLGSYLEPNMTDSTKKNLAWRVECEFGATAGKTELAKVAKKYNLDAIHDTVHEMARDEARHGKALKGLLDRYFK